MSSVFKRKVFLSLVVIAIAALASACAALQPPSATGPRDVEQVYPVLLTEDVNGKEATLAALSRLTSSGPANVDAQLQPVTATILSLPAQPSALFLPKLGAGASMTEEETRESLRRFIRGSQELIGADPTKLSLIARNDLPDGTKSAVYEQRAFRYPLRGGFGKLTIRFAPDRRIVDLTSTCIPDADRLQTTLSGLTPQLLPDDAVKKLRQGAVSIMPSSSAQQNLTVPASANLTPRELVIYVKQSPSRPDALEFHLAWEIEATGLSAKFFYVDAVNGEVVGA